MLFWFGPRYDVGFGLIGFGSGRPWFGFGSALVWVSVRFWFGFGFELWMVLFWFLDF